MIKYNSETPFSLPLHYSLSDASFSSYLRPPNKPAPSSSLHGGRMVDDAEISIFDAQKYFNETTIIDHPAQNTKSSLVISQPPLPMGIHNSNSNSNSNSNLAEQATMEQSSALSSTGGNGNHRRLRSFHVTPTASSEASWNSQVGLLSNPPGSIPLSLKNNVNHHIQRKRGPTKWFFGRKCPCTGKKSVQVLDHNFNPNPKSETPISRKWQQTTSISSMEIIEEKPNSPTFISSQNHHFPSNNNINVHHQQRVYGSVRSFSDRTVGGFSFPILNPPPAKVVLKKGLPPPSTEEEDPPRDSLEVFQPLDGESVSMNATEDDAASDASSDLFEIESFSTQKTSSGYPLCRRRDSLDEATTFNSNTIRRLAVNTVNSNSLYYGRRSMDDSMMTPPTECCYEPSEASIDWSVTTAEGFDRASVVTFAASEMEDMAIRWDNNNNGGGDGGAEGGGGRRKIGNYGYGLLSCRHEKAVSVGPDPVKCVPKEEAGGPAPPIICTLMHASNSSRPFNPNPKKPLIAAAAGSHSARLSLAFAP